MDRPAVARYTLRLFGTPRVADAAGPRTLPGRRALALVAVLAVEGPLTRAKLAELFWGDLDDASAATCAGIRISKALFRREEEYPMDLWVVNDTNGSTARGPRALISGNGLST